MERKVEDIQENKLLGSLLPSSPDFLPIVQPLRDKQAIHELCADAKPIEELFLDGERAA